MARVATPTPLPEPLDYLVPDGLVVSAGDRVRVPLGRRHVLGVVCSVVDDAAVARELKPLGARLDAGPLLSADLLEMAEFIAGYYQAPPGPCVISLLPAALRQLKSPALPRSEKLVRLPGDGRIGARQRRLLELVDAGVDDSQALSPILPEWRQVARTLVRRGMLRITRAPAFAHGQAQGRPAPLNEAQRAAVEAVRAGGARGWLLDGVTGSGKTEVYLELIRGQLAAGRQALYLVPEIGLTGQLLARVRAALSGRIAVLHSQLADGERAVAWLAAGRGEVDVVIGTRSALATPMPRLGLIVVDEEHDPSYKQQDAPCLHARDLALWRGRRCGVPVLLGSATPSLSTLRNVECGRLERLHLPERALAAMPPQLAMVDIRSKRLRGGLCDASEAAIAATLARHEQVLLFRNQRGYAPALLCHDCGWHAGCPRCSANLTVHRRSALLVCHHCGYRARPPKACPECGGLSMLPLGVGTQRIEEHLTERFPGVPVLRIDRDSTARKGAFDRLLQEAERGASCLLVGTQMLAKGHHLPKVTLVVVLDADAALFQSDLHASERLLQLLTQVAGRSGRAELPGRVLVQTRAPGHPLLQRWLADGYAAAAAELLAQRRSAGLPPYAASAVLHADSPDPEALRSFLEAAAQALSALSDPGIVSSGAISAALERRAGRHQGEILIQASDRSRLRRVLARWRPALKPLLRGGLRFRLDVDPIHFG